MQPPISPTRRNQQGATRSPHADRPDAELLALVRDGDNEAFSEIYARCHDEAHRFARRIVGSVAAEDVVAEAFAKTLGAIRRGKGPVDQPIRYVMVAVRTSAYSTFRHADRHPCSPTASEDLPMPASTDAPPLDEHLIAAFETLPQRWRKALWWSEVEGRSPAEIGAMLVLSPAAVSALTYRARRALRAAYLDVAGPVPSD